MTTTEQRLETLEMRVGNLETWAGPGQAEALADGMRDVRADLAKVRQTQDRHTRMLADLTADVSELKTDVATLKTDVATLKTDVATLKSDVATLKSDVATLKSDVATLKSDMTEVMARLDQILQRLPAPPD
jgi:mediator of RNA polymerase II transcription subunit 25